MAPWRLWLLTRRTVGGFTESGGTRLAAAIAYYALLSLFPLAVVLVAGASLVLPEEGARAEVVDRIVEGMPLSESGRDDLRGALEGAIAGAGAVGIVSLVALMWTASGLMGAVRTGLTAVTHADDSRPWLRGKAVDLVMVLLTGVVFIVAAGSTVAARVAGESVLEPIGLGALTGPLLGILTPIALAFLVLGALLRLVPAEPIPWSGVWRGAAAGAVAVWALATGFGVYVENFGRYNALYGSLGAAAALLVFVFLTAIVLLATAAAAAYWPEVAAATRPERTGPDEPVGRKVRRALLGLVVRR